MGLNSLSNAFRIVMSFFYCPSRGKSIRDLFAKYAMVLSVMPCGILASSVFALDGIVLDPNGRPIVDASISVQGSTQLYTTNEQGKFTIDLDEVSEIHVEAEDFNHKVIHLHDEQDTGGLLRIELSYNVLEVVDVIGIPIHTSAIESSLPVTVLDKDELAKVHADTLGETLKNEPGIHSTYYGGVASSPIIRSLEGPRVLVTQNGLDVSDASRVGPDHVTTAETVTAEQVEVLRGPATLFYGSGAIGGVVNIVDNRVPRSSDHSLALGTEYNTVNNQYGLSGAYTGGNERLAVYLDGFHRDGDDYDIPGLADEDDEDSGGSLENSFSESYGFTVGVSKLFENGFVGLSYGKLDRLNGIPGHGHEDEHEEDEEHDEEESDEHDEEEEETILSDLQQDRIQLLSEFDLDHPLFSIIETKLGYTDYEHSEIEDGERGTTFKNEAFQARVDITHEEIAHFNGALSLELKRVDFEAIGEEAFTPPSETNEYAIALLEETHSGDFLWQFGARLEHVQLSADSVSVEDELTFALNDFDFTPVNLSGGVVWDYLEGYNVGLSLTHAERAPNAAEIYSLGPHIATETFEIGSLFAIAENDEGEAELVYQGDADKEVSNNIDLSFRKFEGDFGFIVSFFYNDVSDFFALRATGLESEELFHDEDGEEQGNEDEEGGHEHGEESLPVFIFQQSDVELAGMEFELAYKLNSNWKWFVWGDTVQAEFANGEYLPRISPSRLATRLRYENNAFAAELGLVNVFEQENTASNESSTESYQLLDIKTRYSLPGISDASVFLNIDNLLDEEARVHTSFLKDTAPLPGRNFRFGVRASF